MAVVYNVSLIFSLCIPFTLFTQLSIKIRGSRMTSVKNAEECYPPCRKACPAHINIQAYIALISQGKLKEALEIIRKDIPLPAVCGRVCFSPCEDACTRKDIDEALSIRALKRLVADYELKDGKYEKPKPAPRKYKEKIAIIGSGPAGIAAAYELVRIGYPVTIFEKSSKAGGMLRECIPSYRLPKDVLDAELQYIMDLGVEIKTNSALGKDFTIESLSDAGYKAIFIATGAPKSLNLNCEGENLHGVLHSIEFLKKVNAGEKIELGEKVAVIGGGNVAIDSARTAKRLGVDEVTIIYRRSEMEMPAHHKEVEEAKAEGVKFLFLASPKRFIGDNGKLVAVECLKMRLGPPDESGRRRPIPIEGSEFLVQVNTTILAIGEKPDVSFLPKTIEISKRNTIIVDPLTLETKMPGVFAGGDVVTGPASVIDAIAAGKKAAVSINRYLRGMDLKAGREKEIPETTWVPSEEVFEKRPRQLMPVLAASERSTNFQEVELGYDVETGIREAYRCFFCAPCVQCLEMEELCEPDDVIVDEDKCIACANCEKICEFGAIKVEKFVAKVNQNLCKGCGTCAVECPALAISMTNFTNEKLSNLVMEAKKIWRDNEPRIVAFICNWSHREDINQLKEKASFQIIPVKCTGRVDPYHILQAFQTGADGVLIIGCSENDCHYGFGALTTAKRIKETKIWLKAVGINPEKLHMGKASAAEKDAIIRIAANFASHLKEIDAGQLQRL
jgi:putative selenate reductase YgfK subunit